jgi:hypothetical protein
VEAFLEAALNGKPDKAAALGEPGQSPSREDSVRKDFSELNVKNGKLPITRLIADDSNALAITENVVIASEKRAGPLVLTLVRKDGRWMVNDIDLKTNESVLDEVKRFQQRRPQSKLVFERQYQESKGL